MMKNEHGFTLVEMMIVLFVITILLLITIPNVSKNYGTISNKGCEGMVNMVQSQIQAYQIDHGVLPTSMEDLTNGDYLERPPVCPDGTKIIIAEGIAKKENE